MSDQTFNDKLARSATIMEYTMRFNEAEMGLIRQALLHVQTCKDGTDRLESIVDGTTADAGTLLARFTARRPGLDPAA